MVLGAVRSGAIASEVDPDLLLRHLESVLRSVMFDWVVGEISPARLGAMARHGYALILLGAAADDWRGPLRARVLETQASLAAPA